MNPTTPTEHPVAPFDPRWVSNIYLNGVPLPWSSGPQRTKSDAVWAAKNEIATLTPHEQQNATYYAYRVSPSTENPL